MKTTIPDSRNTHGFDEYVKALELPDEVLFKTDVDLWPIYLNSFEDQGDRQYHNCHTCRKFLQNFGNLVRIDAQTGTTVAAVWSSGHAPKGYEKAVSAMRKATEKAKVTGVFFSKDTVLGTPVTGEWTHFAVKNPAPYRKSALTSGQKAAEKKEDYRNVSRGLSEFKLEILEQVVELLRSDSLYRSEKVLGQAEWLFNTKKLVVGEKHQLRRKNIIWRAIADAPSGFCHPRSSMIGTLLDDLDAGLSFKVAADKFKAKMHPLQYQRPTAAPPSGAILAAEKLVKELGVEASLERRYAMLGDLQTIWLPKEEGKEQSAGVFDHLKEEAKNPVCADAGKITWSKFSSDVLPNARKIEVLIPAGRSPYRVFLTAQNEEAPIIFQWGNPVSWYFWHGGVYPSSVSLASGWVEAVAACLVPYMWDGKEALNRPKDMAFILKGAHETRNENSALFPETLKSEFHGIRSVVEAHSCRTKIHEIAGEHAIGKGIGCTVRVHTSVVTQYEIDRWD